MKSGTFVLTDIGGYTGVLSDVGIEHANEITSHLLNRVVEVDLSPARYRKALAAPIRLSSTNGSVIADSPAIGEFFTGS